MKKRAFAILLKLRNRHLFVLDMIAFSLIPALCLIHNSSLISDSFELLSQFAMPLAIYTLTSLVIKQCVFIYFNFYSRYWSYASVDEIVALLEVTSISCILNIIAFFGILKPTGLLPATFPIAMPVLDVILTMLIIGGVRVAIRIAYVLSERMGMGISVERKNVLIVGAGLTGSMIVKELRGNPQLGLIPIAFVDDDPAKQHVRIHGVDVLGTINTMVSIVERKAIQEVIVAMPTAPGKVIREIVKACKTANVPSRTIPSIHEILGGSAVAQLRDIRIEDLLRRGTVKIDSQDVARLLRGARVLVTGAGGSIGGELCRQVAALRPKEIVLLGHGEDSIFHIAAELTSRYGIINEPVVVHPVIADLRDSDRMDQVFKQFKPTIVFHAAAHKHVGLMEKNLSDAVTNNVLGTQILVDLADRYDVERLVMISSDKAVNPTNVMGVTKRVAEIVVGDAADRTGKNFVTVRFGNVLGSNGSVVPIFQRQIESGGPIKVTHPDVTRFFMTIPEAVQLVLQAGTIGHGGEILVLDMGEPRKIVDIARDMLRLSGLSEGVDIDIVFTGLQKGEKMHEELFYEMEKPEKSKHENIFVCKNGRHHYLAEEDPSDTRIDETRGSDWLNRSIQQLVGSAKAGNTEAVYYFLKKIVPQYTGGESAPVQIADLAARGGTERYETKLKLLEGSDKTFVKSNGRSLKFWPDGNLVLEKLRLVWGNDQE
jgi:FlaA1/EpsC-like NDP-sugar epimerase